MLKKKKQINNAPSYLCHLLSRDFIKELRNDLKRAPKFSRSESARAEKARSKNSIEVQKGNKKVEDRDWDSDMETLKIR